MHGKQWEYLNRLLQAGRIPQAMIFFGPDYLNKKEVAINFIKLVNCQHGKPCNKCESCLAIEGNNYPDLTIIEPEKGSISIKQVKRIKENLSLKSYSSSVKSIIIDKAETMGTDAQNSLLKILEEPRGESVFILIVSKINGLLETIRSRCQILKFYPDSFYFKGQEMFPKISRLMEGSLGQRMVFIKNYFNKEFSSEKVSLFLEIWENYLRMVLLKKMSIIEGNYNLSSYSIDKIKDILNHIEKNRQIIDLTNANPRLAIEDIILNI